MNDMTEKFPLLDFAKISSMPKRSFVFLWADYVELQCVISEDKSYSRGYLQDVLSDQDDLGADYHEGDDEVEPKITEDNDDEHKIDSKWSDIKTRLNIRKQCLDDAWPFIFDGDVLQLNFDPKSKKQRLYLLLLLCSCLRYCNKKRYDELTGALEDLGYCIFEKLMPNGWIVKQFGAKNYPGKLYIKMQALMNQLNGVLLIKKDDYEEGNVGDGKIDLVAWHPLTDERGFMPIAFAQCGCSPTDWEHKQLEASMANLSNVFSLQHPAQNYYFMPHDLRKSSTQFDRRGNIGQVILIDRIRMLKLCELYSANDDSIYDKQEFPHTEIIDELLAFNKEYID
ncbi:hypothetical protein [Sodalis sp. C49]|uniref:hypothetical protein n=1 Tax=Sodalis sp. C49 TaxID=3228929 RepID=UPI003965C311